MNNTPNRKYLLLGFLVLVLIYLLVYIFQHSVVIISFSTEANADISIKRTGYDNAKKINKGIKIVRNGSYFLDFKSGTSLTRKFVDVRPFHINRVNADFQPQKQLYKVATNSKPCIYGSSEEIKKGNLYSYDCLSLDEPLLHNYSQLLNGRPSLKHLGLSHTGPYKEGVVGIKLPVGEGGSDTAVSYVSEKSNINISLNSSFNIDTQDLRLDIYENSVFVLNTKSGELATLDQVAEGEKPKYSSLALPQEAGIVRSFHSWKNQFFVYGTSRSGSIGEASEGASMGHLYVFDKNKKEAVNEIEVKDKNLSDELGGFSLLDEETLVTDSPKRGVLIVNIGKGKLSLKEIIPDSIQHTMHNGNLYILSSDSQVFKYDVKQRSLYLVFGSKRTKISNIRSVDSGVVLSGYAEGDRVYDALTFLLTDNDFEDTGRIEDILPFAYQPQSYPVATVDYLGNNIVIAIPPIGGTDINSIKKSVLDDLKNKGVDFNKYSISFQ